MLVEAAEADAAARLELGEQQRGYEEAGQRSEDVDPEEAARQPSGVGMEEQNGRDGDGTHPVKARHPVQRAGARPTRGGGARWLARSADSWLVGCPPAVAAGMARI